MVIGLPWKQGLLLVMIYVFSFANFYWIFYELGFPSNLPVLLIIITAAFGLTFLMYNLIFKLSRILYKREIKFGKEKSSEGEGMV